MTLILIIKILILINHCYHQYRDTAADNACDNSAISNENNDDYYNGSNRIESYWNSNQYKQIILNINTIYW